MYIKKVKKLNHDIHQNVQEFKIGILDHINLFLLIVQYKT